MKTIFHRILPYKLGAYSLIDVKCSGVFTRQLKCIIESSRSSVCPVSGIESEDVLASDHSLNYSVASPPTLRD